MCPIKILPVDKIRELDAYTISHEPIKSVDLMERAATACYNWINSTVREISSFKIICGMGNNGGDGLALARLLHTDGHSVEVYYIRHTAEATPDNLTNFRKIADSYNLVITEVYENDSQLEFSDEDIIVDALLGSGLNKPVSGFLATIIDQINASKGIIISIDIPSGLFADAQTPDNRSNGIVNADYTLTFQLPKLAFFMPENDRFVGKWIVLNIELDETFIEKSATKHFLTNSADARQVYKPRKRFAHKGTFGHGLLISGSLGKIGAATLSASAAVRSGAGLISVQLPSCGTEIMQISVPEVMVNEDTNGEYISEMPHDLAKYSAIAVGPGIGTSQETQKALRLLIQETKVPLIIDADGLNILAENKTWLSFLPKNSILTPHLKEFERLTSPVRSHFDRLDILSAFANRHSIYVILKGAFSAIADPSGNIYFNSTGNPGMATGGSGDVLTGILLGLVTSGYKPFEACIMGTWLHGKAGDIAARKMGEESLIASDLVKNLSAAFKKLH